MKGLLHKAVRTIGISSLGFASATMAQTTTQTDQSEVSTLKAIQATGQASSSEATPSYQFQGAEDVLKLPLTLHELPQSATVITRQRMDDQNLTTLGEVLEQSPGITRSQNGDAGAGYTNFNARGFSVNNYFIDGVITTPNALEGSGGISVMDTAIYDRVTVVRGATGLLSGAGEPSAAVMMQRKRPTRDLKAQASVGAGTWHRYRAMADISTPLNQEGSVRARFVAAHNQGRSWKDGYKGRRNILYGVVEADLSAQTVLRTGIEHMEDRYTGASMHAFSVSYTDGTPINWGRHDSATADWAYYKQRRTMLFGQLEHSWNEGWNAQLALSRTWLNNEQLYGVAAPAPQPNGRGSLTAGFTELTPVTDAVDVNINGKYQAFGRKHDIMLGGNYFELSRHNTVYSRQRLPIPNIKEFRPNLLSKPTLQPSGPSNLRTRQWGGYAATRLSLTDQFAAILGSRITYWKNQSNQTLRKETGVFTPYLGLIYDITPQIAAYTSYTQIFSPQNRQDREGNYLDPERGNNYELGLKYLSTDETLSASAAIFQTRKDNLAVVDGNELTPEGGQAYVAKDDTKSHGFEVEANGEISPGWNLGAGYTFYRFRDGEGDKIKTNLPSHQIKLFTSYRLPGEWNRLTVGGGVNWQSKIYASSTTGLARRVNTQKAYAVVNLMARYEINKHADVSVNVDNLFDKTYRLSATGYTFGAPRNIMATLRYKF